MSAESLEDLRVDLLVCGENALIALRGEIDFSNRAQLAAPLATAVRADVNVTLDLAEVAFMDIGGVQLIAETEKALAAAGHQLRGVHPQSAVRRVFSLLGADHLLQP